MSKKNSKEASTAGPELEPKVFEIVGNRIYFYSEIERDKILSLNKELRELDTAHISDKQKLGTSELVPIYLYINSYGGSVSAGFSAVDNILSCKSPVITVVDGIAASAATLLSLAGSKRCMSEHSVMLIHQLSTMMWGSYEQVGDCFKNATLQMDMIVEYYTEKTKLTKVKLKEMLKRDLYFSAKECLEYGLIDVLI